jgi:hypothetical protein
MLKDRLNVLNHLDSNVLAVAVDVDARIEHYDSSVTETVPVPSAASFWPGVTVKYSGMFAGNSVSVATAVGVPSPILTVIPLATVTTMIWNVSGPKAVDAALLPAGATF